MLKSKLCSPCPPESIAIPAKYQHIVISAEAVQAEIQRLRSQFQSIVPISGPAEPGDFVAASSVEQSYTLNTARPYIMTELTNACLGKCAGTSFPLPDGTQWTITAVKRKLPPPFDDQLARRSGADSAADYVEKTKEQLIAEAKKRKMYAAEEFLSQQLIQNSQYTLAHAEIQEMQEELLDEIHSGAQESGMSPAAMAAEWLQMFGLPEPEDPLSPEQAAAQMAEYQLKTILLGCWYLKQLGGELTEKQYEKRISQMTTKEGLTADEARKALSYPTFLFTKASSQVSFYARKYLRQAIQFDITVEE